MFKVVKSLNLGAQLNGAEGEINCSLNLPLNKFIVTRAV